jgi:hypothetical protein
LFHIETHLADLANCLYPNEMGTGTLKHLRASEKGSALINAIIVVGLVAAISATIFSQTQITDKTSRNPRVKSAMAVMESEVRALASSASSYTCQGVGTQMNCQIKSEIFNSLKRSVSGSVCPHGSQDKGSQGLNSFCGIQVGPIPGVPYFVPSTRTFSARVTYQGGEVAMKPIDVSFQLAEGVFHSGPFTCPVGQPFFAGYDGSGNPVCRPVPSTCYETMNLDSPGVYIYSLDAYTLRPHCKSLTAVNMVGCTSTGYLNKISLDTGVLDTACGNRQNAFSVFAYNPGSVTQVAAVPQGGGYPVTEPPPPPSSGGGGGGTGGGGTPTPTTLPSTTTTMATTTTTAPHGGGGGGGGGCFVAGTPILMADGSQKAIEQIQVGDQVMGFDDENRTPLAQAVVKLHHHQANDQDLLEFHMADGEVFVPNAIHPIFVVEQNAYFPTSEIATMLNAGVKISLLRADGAVIGVQSIVIKKAFTPVYNFEVEGLKSVSSEFGAFGSGHNYYADGFLVHNAVYGTGLGKVIQVYLTGVPSFGLIKVKTGD